MARSYHHGDLKRAIEDAAHVALESGGPDAVSLRAIAREIGVSQGAPYHHFPNRNALLASLATTTFVELHQAMIAAVDAAGPDPFDRLTGICQEATRYCIDNPGRFRLMFGSHMAELEKHEAVYAAGRPTRVMLEDLVADCLGRDAPGAAEAELAVWALIHGLVSLTIQNEIPRDGRFRSLEDTVTQSFALLIEGIREHGAKLAADDEPNAFDRATQDD